MPETKPIRSFHDVPGWFRWLDKTMFDALLEAQSGQPLGAVVELGVYLGKSAVVLGDHLRPGERLVLVDLFGTDPSHYESDRESHARNRRENASSYASLERDQFEANYLALHDSLPEVITGPSTCILEHVEEHSVRFLHVDAGHLYDNVREDVANARKLLRPGGIAVFDDWRAEHTPGVTAAVWEGVVKDGLIPFALNSHKLYGTYDDGAPYAEALRALFDSDKRYWYEEQVVMGHKILRARAIDKPAKPATPAVPADLQKLADDIAERVVKKTAELRRAQRAAHTQAANVAQRSDRVDQAQAKLRTARAVARNLLPAALRRTSARGRTRKP